jgi:hygromycin-B 7''-O-kinase
VVWVPPPRRNIKVRDHLPLREWVAPLREICARHALDARALEPFASGSDVVWCAGDVVIKLSTPAWSAQMESERRALAHAAGRLSVATPRLLCHGELAGWPYIVMSRVAGAPLADVWPGLDARDRRRLARELGALLRELHALGPCTPDDWPAFWSRCRTDLARRHAEPDAPPELVRAIEPFLAAQAELDGPERLFLHTEYLDQHVLVDDARGRWEPVAVIDFADTQTGPPWYDFAAPVEFVFRGERGLLRAFLGGYGVDPDGTDPERMLAWALAHRLGRLARMLEAVAPAAPRDLRALARLLYAVDA